MSAGYKRKLNINEQNQAITAKPPLDANTSFATKTALAFKNAYSSQNPSVLLDMFIYFRNNDQTVTYKSTSSALLNMTSDIFTSIGSNIAGLPKELNPEAIDKILAYIHGDALIFPKPLHDESLIHKTFIAATYFRQAKLANKLKSYAIENLNLNLDWDDMVGFVRSLPPPVFLHQFPSNIDQLPSCEAPSGRDTLSNEVKSTTSTWRQQTITSDVGQQQNQQHVQPNNIIQQNRIQPNIGLPIVNQAQMAGVPLGLPAPVSLQPQTYGQQPQSIGYAPTQQMSGYGQPQNHASNHARIW